MHKHSQSNTYTLAYCHIGIRSESVSMNALGKKIKPCHKSNIRFAISIHGTIASRAHAHTIDGIPFRHLLLNDSPIECAFPLVSHTFSLFSSILRKFKWVNPLIFFPCGETRALKWVQKLDNKRSEIFLRLKPGNWNQATSHRKLDA